MSTKYEDLEVYKLSEKLSDIIWDIVVKWNSFEKDVVGRQLIKAADSVSANISEGSGKGSYIDYKRYLKISRGSLFETKHWVNKAFKRKLLNDADKETITKMIDELIPRLSAFIKYMDTKSQIK